MIKSTTIIFLAIIMVIMHDEWNGLNDNPAVIPLHASVASDRVKSAVYKMGPQYQYKMIDKKLYVNRGDGQWLRLRY